MKNIWVIDKCPCCGEVAIMLHNDGSIRSYYGLPTSFIQCQGCGLRTGYGSEEENVAIWNRRLSNEN